MEKKGRIDSAIKWAKNKCGRQISLRVARKYLEDDAYFLAASDARAAIGQEMEATPVRTPGDTRVRRIQSVRSYRRRESPMRFGQSAG